jgi:hypothetical protein
MRLTAVRDVDDKTHCPCVLQLGISEYQIPAGCRTILDGRDAERRRSNITSSTVDSNSNSKSE